MNKTESYSKTTVDRAVNLIHRDISARSLRTGEPYLTSREAGKMLGVSVLTANRALKKLADRQVLVRQRRRGSFVGPQAQLLKEPGKGLVHVLVPEHLYRTWNHLGPMMLGLRRQLPDVDVQFNFLREHEAIAHARQLVETHQKSGSSTSFVLVGVPRAVCQYFQEQHVPAVVHGHVDPGVNLPWVDRNQRQIGELVAKHLVAGGHRHVGLLMRDAWRPGDNLLVAGLTSEFELSEVQIGLTVSSMPAGDEATDAAIFEILTQASAPTGIICKADWMAERAIVVARKLRVKCALVLVAGQVKEQVDGWDIVGVSFEPESIGEHIGRLLMQVAQGIAPDPHHYALPVSLLLKSANR
jgi:DNA-binding LacI/PurR family transcriptional regulator